jgi:hypothetical protein
LNELDRAFFGVRVSKARGALGTLEQKVFCFLDSEISPDGGKSFQKVFGCFS